MKSTEQPAQGPAPAARESRRAIPIILVGVLALAGLVGAMLGVATHSGTTARVAASGSASGAAARSGSDSTVNPTTTAPTTSAPATTTTRPTTTSPTAKTAPTTTSPPGGIVPPTTSPTTTTAPGAFTPSAADLVDAKAMLENEAQHGWDSCYNGLYINWNDTAGATVGNWNGTGQPDATPCTRHEDRMTTLRYLDGLLLYKADTGSTEFDAEIARIEPHVLALFTTANPDARGWAYDTVVQIAQLSGNPAFTAIANSMLHRYATSPADSTRPDWQFEEASALVQSGVPAYVSLGTTELNQYWQADALPNLGLVNEPSIIVTADQVDIATALARAGFTSQANQMLNGLEAHLWDPVYGGFGEGAVYSNGSLSLKTKKTGGRMMNVMQLGKSLDNPTLVSTMDSLFQQHIYQSSPNGYQGVLYEQRPDWSLYTIGGTTETWVTSEAMGISDIALLSPN